MAMITGYTMSRLWRVKRSVLAITFVFGNEVSPVVLRLDILAYSELGTRYRKRGRDSDVGRSDLKDGTGQVKVLSSA